ncbi:hypothetical protein ABPG75_000036 [Micractinium tetrahymenae]
MMAQIFARPPSHAVQGLVPAPAAHQQTLRRSFTVGGIGLHTGEYAIVRVLPAFAGEGRYFVRVPRGTNEHEWELEQPQERELEDLDAPAFTAKHAPNDVSNAQLFFEFIKAQEDGEFSVSFEDYFQRHAAQPETLLLEAEAELRPEEEPAMGQPGEARVPATVSSLRQQGHSCTSVLQQGDAEVWGAEHLLAALECCGIDNARIEIEGGKEVPIVDGSALGWANEVQRCGLRAAPTQQAADALAARAVLAPREMVTVQDGEAFITFYPGPSARVTVGVDHSAEAPIVGRQWFSWSPEDAGYTTADHFRYAVAPALTVYTAKTANKLVNEGLLQAGADRVCLVADQDDWMDPTLVRFEDDEAARHAAIDLLGDLSLLAQPGGRGLPMGHVVAYQPTHALQAAFMQRMAEALA